jgi:ribosomal protein S18 acetylase RimI-like enzyme
LDHRSKSHDPQDFGKLRIKVLLVKNKPVGFVAYYMENFFQGKVLFLDIDHTQRRHRYGQKLLTGAMQALFAQGAKVVRLVTRTDNIPAQRLYSKNGFIEYQSTDKFVYFEKKAGR